VIFESYGTYEQKGREFPKDVMVYGRDETRDQAGLSFRRGKTNGARRSSGCA
jgi:hypothetical protein